MIRSRIGSHKSVETSCADFGERPLPAGCAAWASTIRCFPDSGSHYIELAIRESGSSRAACDSLIVDFDALATPVGATLAHACLISDCSVIEPLLPITPMLQPA